MMIFSVYNRRSPEEPLTKLHDLARMICTGAGLIRPISMKNTI